MIVKLFAIILIVLSTSAPFVQTAIAPTQAALSPSQTLLLAKISTVATRTGNCFFPLVVRLNVTWTGANTIYVVSMDNFWLVVSTRNVVVSNSTNLSYSNPTNTIGFFDAFPNLPVTLLLSFPKTCVTNVGDARLLYLDGSYNYTFTLP